MAKRTKEEALTIFKKFDTDHNGTIDEVEFVKGMMECFGIKEDDMNTGYGFFLTALFKLSDQSGFFKFKDNKLDLKEMTKVLAAVPEPLSNDPLENIAKTIFSILDADNNKYISKREFKKYAEAASMSKKVMARKLKEMDEDNNGKIDFNEFSDWISTTYEAIKN